MPCLLRYSQKWTHLVIKIVNCRIIANGVAWWPRENKSVSNETMKNKSSDTTLVDIQLKQN